MITKIRYNLTKTGKNAGSKMAVFTLLDLQGQVEVVMFPNTLNQFATTACRRRRRIRQRPAGLQTGKTEHHRLGINHPR